MIRVSFTGVQEFMRAVAGAPKALKRAGDKASREAAEEVAKKLRENIREGSLNLAALSEPYATRKEAQYGEQPILIASGGYVDSIGIERGGPGVWHVVPGEDYRERALWLEFGTRTMPPRPHWRPTQEDAKKIVPEIGQRAMSLFASYMGAHK